MKNEKRERRVEVRFSNEEYDDLKKRVEQTSFKNNSDFLRSSVYIVDLVRQALKNNGIDFYKDSEIYNKIDKFREKKKLEKICRRKNKKHVTVPQIDPKLLNQVIRSGNNLNQIAYNINKAVKYNEQIDAYEILSHLLEIENQNKEIIELMKVSKYQNSIKKGEVTEIEEEEEISDDSRIY